MQLVQDNLVSDNMESNAPPFIHFMAHETIPRMQ